MKYSAAPLPYTTLADMPKPPAEDRRLVRLTELCLKLPEAMRAVNGDHADFRVRKKVFAYFLNNHHGDGIVSVCVKTELGDNVDLAGGQPDIYYLPAYIGTRGWVGMRLDRGAIDWRHVWAMLKLSWSLAAPKTIAALVWAPDFDAKAGQA